jgi:hypothetical protein
MLNLELAHSIYKDREREVNERLRTRAFREALTERYEPAFVDPAVTMSGRRSGLRLRSGSISSGSISSGSMEVIARPR